MKQEQSMKTTKANLLGNKKKTWKWNRFLPNNPKFQQWALGATDQINKDKIDISCLDCKNFIRNTINPMQGFGKCTAGYEQKFPMRRHTCKGFEKK